MNKRYSNISQNQTTQTQSTTRCHNHNRHDRTIIIIIIIVPIIIALKRSLKHCISFAYTTTNFVEISNAPEPT